MEDRLTDRQTDLGIKAPSRSLTTIKNKDNLNKNWHYLKWRRPQKVKTTSCFYFIWDAYPWLLYLGATCSFLKYEEMGGPIVLSWVRAVMTCAHTYMCSDLHKIWNLSSQDSNWPPHKISWRSKLSYFHSFAPQKSFKVDNYWMDMDVFGN